MNISIYIYTYLDIYMYIYILYMYIDICIYVDPRGADMPKAPLMFHTASSYYLEAHGT